MSETTAVIVQPGDYSGDYSVDFVRDAWLDAKHGRSQSDATHAKYKATLDSFRAACRRRGFDLDGDTTALATIAQVWAKLPRERDGASASPATVNLRLAVVSSFYSYARKMEYLRGANPIERVERARGDGAHAAAPFTDEQVREGLSRISGETPQGRRDRALLAVALYTGRRLSEIANMRLRDVEWTLDSYGMAHAQIVWPRTKGGKRAKDELHADVAAVLAAYIVSDRVDTDPASPVWVSYRGPHHTRGGQLSAHALEAICERVFGVSKFHATRHTLARRMEDSGAKVSEIQAQLGHSNIAITSRYLQRNRRKVNPYADSIAAMLGLTVAK